MTLTTLLRYLVGDREAILTIAGNRHTLWIGLLFVVSAGFAREYDAEDLLHEPWYIFIPVAASLASSFLLFTLAYCLATRWGNAPWRRFFPRYLVFLRLFWMTAPLAWLYAVPYERFLSPLDAMRANLMTLGIVALWRVLLMIRVLMVLLRYSFVSAVALVLLFSAVLILGLQVYLPFPLIEIMGGIHLGEREAVLRGYTSVIGCCSTLSLPGLAFLLMHPRTRCEPSWRLRTVSTTFSLPLVVLAVASVLVWAPVLPSTQPPHARRRAVERLYSAERYHDALAVLSSHQPADYPVGWEPPPMRKVGFGENAELLPILRALGEQPCANWVRELYLDKAEWTVGDRWFSYRTAAAYEYAAVLRRIPGGWAILERILSRLEEEASATAGRSSAGEKAVDLRNAMDAAIQDERTQQ